MYGGSSGTRNGARVKPAPAPAKYAARARGFSLIELMVTIVIAAILIAIAVPSYNNYVRQGRRTEAKTALLDMASLEERYFNTQNQYTLTPTDLGYSGTAGTPMIVGSGYYQILTVAPSAIVGALLPAPGTPAGTPATFTLTAVPVPGTDQVNDLACTSFTINSAGQQSAAGADPNASVDCWQ
jgi:type IV pilus assembly protein PilE